ncbi:MAG: site-specific DNA-methyltransferase [Hyphomicrobiaceae bacterium]
MDSQSRDSPRLAIEPLPLGLIVRNKDNARKHSSKQIEQLAQSIRKFGFLAPVIVDDGNLLLCGHARVEAAQQTGMATVPAIRVGHLNEVQKRAFMIADNRLAELASWDEALLKNELQFLSACDIDFDFSAIGFETPELDIILTSGDAEEDRLPETPSNRAPISKPGDLWLLGGHRLICGDALQPSSYAVLLGDERARLVFTDPPYNVRVKGHVSGLGAVKHREFAMASGEMTQAEFTAFLGKAFEHLAAFTADGSIHFVCMDWRHLQEIMTAGTANYTELKNICVWRKTNAGMGSLYRSQHEFIFVFKNGRAPHTNNIELGSHGRYRTNVWDYQGINNFGRDRNALLASHPTVKPVALVADAIQDCSKRRDLVLDPFAGSGTTIIAAEKTNRRAAAIELDPVYVDTIVRRWQAFTGKQATCAQSGMTFAECEASLAAVATGDQAQQFHAEAGSA